MKSQDEQWLLKEKYNGEKTAAFYLDCKALALGEPLGYLIGHVPFLDCTIYLDGRPLIPRPETEFWVEQAIAAITEADASQPSLSAEVTTSVNVLDLCAGSGCVGVAVANAIMGARVDFAEIDARLLPTIEKNVAENVDNPSRCQPYHSNLFAGLRADKKYSFIFSNPPYIDPALNRVDESVRDFEPHLALFGGEAGLDVISQLIAATPNHLVAGGQLWIEHEPEQSKQIAVLGTKAGFQVTHHPDQYDVERYSVLVLI